MNITNKFQTKKETKFETGGKCQLNEDLEVAKVPRFRILDTGNILCSQYISRIMIK